MSETTNPTHIDEWIDDYGSHDAKRVYAQWFFMLARLPAIDKMRFQKFIGKYKLFCTYKNKRYRVTGASRLGDVWLTSNFSQDTGYEHRVNVDDCSNWSDKR